MRYRLSEGQAIARGVSVLVFFGAAVLSLLAALIEEAEEASITWGDRYVVALLIFCGANLAAAGLAAFPGRSVTLRALGALTLVPAVMCMSEYKGHPIESTGLAVAAVALVMTGGLVAGVVVRSPRCKASHVMSRSPHRGSKRRTVFFAASCATISRV